MKKTLLAPSLLSADFGQLQEMLKIIEMRGGSVVHIDVMDGRFVPEITYGQPVIRSIRPLSRLPFDVHLTLGRYREFSIDYDRDFQGRVEPAREFIKKPINYVLLKSNRRG